jgi:aminoacrylate hydrolase
MVITHDHPGTGRSTKPTLQYSTEDFVDDAAAILDHLNAGPAILCGHSMGGRIIQLLALKYPAKVKEMIIASSGAGHPGMAKGIPFQLCKEMVELGYEGYVRDHTLEVGWTGVPRFVELAGEAHNYFFANPDALTGPFGAFWRRRRRFR